MTSTPSQDNLKDPRYFPALPRKMIAQLYGYSESHIRNITQAGYVYSYTVIVSNYNVTMVSVASMNAYVRRQEQRRAS